MTKPLRAVAPGELAPKSPPMTVVEAADTGTQRDLLVALRARVAGAVANPDTPARDLAALSRRLMEIARDIEAIDSAAKENGLGNATETPDDAWVAG